MYELADSKENLFVFQLIDSLPRLRVPTRARKLGPGRDASGRNLMGGATMPTEAEDPNNEIMDGRRADGFSRTGGGDSWTVCSEDTT
jgi:hypothetical protein